MKRNHTVIKLKTIVGSAVAGTVACIIAYNTYASGCGQKSSQHEDPPTDCSLHGDTDCLYQQAQYYIYCTKGDRTTSCDADTVGLNSDALTGPVQGSCQDGACTYPGTYGAMVTDSLTKQTYHDGVCN